MTDREMLIWIHGKLSQYPNSYKAELAMLNQHFKGSPTPDRLSLEARVKTLEKVVTSRGYQLDEELATA